jgi:hypothetical protein
MEPRHKAPHVSIAETIKSCGAKLADDMTFHDYYYIALAIGVFIVLPAWGMVALWRYSRLSPKERRQRREAARSSPGAAALGSAFGVLDKVIRPSAEFQIEAQEKIVKEDEKGGD